MKFSIPLDPESTYPKRGRRGSGKNKVAIQKQLAKSQAIAQQAQRQATTAASKKLVWAYIEEAFKEGHELHICIHPNPPTDSERYTISLHYVDPIDPRDLAH
jgi:hypothetical protein